MKNIIFLSNINGLRVRKGDKYYFYDEDKLVLEIFGNNKIYYYYDNTGVIGFKYMENSSSRI